MDATSGLGGGGGGGGGPLAGTVASSFVAKKVPFAPPITYIRPL